MGYSNPNTMTFPRYPSNPSNPPRPNRNPTAPRRNPSDDGQPAPNASTVNMYDLRHQGQGANAFGGYGEDRFRQLGDESAHYRAGLRSMADGSVSLSAEQLRQGLQQNIAGQQAAAASAHPANAAMAARTAAIQASRMGTGLSGQQAMAGIAERQAAMQSLGNMLISERGQDLQAAQGSRGQAINAYGMASDAALGKARDDAAAQKAHDDRVYGAVQGGITAGGMALSDRRLKTDIADGGADADAFIKGLKAYRFKYKDAKHGGAGDHLGIMAQDLEATRLGRQAVVETGAGKAVHGARLATSLAAATARLGERLAKLEGGRK